MTTLVRGDHDRVATITLDRPHRRNALTVEMLERLVAALAEVADDLDVGAVVLTGAGDAFCSGADVAEFANRPDDPGRARRIELVAEAMQRLQHLPKPTIAAVAGPAIGAGWGLALSCDVCYAEAGAVFQLPEIAKGYRLPPAIVRRLRAVVGPVVATYIVLGGVPLHAAEALRIGCLARVIDPPGTALAVADDAARQWAAHSADAIAAALGELRRPAAVSPAATSAKALPQQGER